jgi:hypothetical protein
MRTTRFWIRVEDALIMLSIAALWPKILRLPGHYPDVLMWTAFVVMVGVLVRRMTRMEKPVGDTEEETPR